MIRIIWRRLINLGFKLLYNQLAWSYDLVSWLVSLGQWRNWQRTAVPFLHGRDLLEIGHGPGHLLIELRQMGYRVTAIDLSPYMGRMAQQRLRRAAATAPLLRCQAEDLPFTANAFDTVLATFPAPFIIEPKTLTAVRRVLRCDGRFIIVLGAEQMGNRLPQRFVSWLFRITGQGPISPPTEADPHLPPHLVARFTAAGFHLAAEYIYLPTSRALVLIGSPVAE
jgi:ubiquinone/menaquinone biosynthesis C-methylase UbiE